MSQSKKTHSKQSQDDVNEPARATELSLGGQIVGVLQELAQKFHDCHVQYTSEQKTQCLLVEQMHALGQRHSILKDNNGPGADGLPIAEVEPVELLLVDFNNLYQQLLASNKSLQDGVHALHEIYKTFKKLQHQLEFVQSKPSIGIDAKHNPFGYYIEFVDDVHIYINNRVLKLKHFAETIKPTHLQQLEIYKQLLVPNADFEEQLLLGLAYYKCLKNFTKTKHKEPLYEHEKMPPPPKRCVKFQMPKST